MSDSQEELRELVETWRSTAEWYRDRDGERVAANIEQCADELEEYVDAE